MPPELSRVLGGLEQLAKTRKRALSGVAAEDAGVLEKRRVDAARRPFEMAGRSTPKKIEMIEAPRGADVSSGHALDLSALGDWDLAHFQPLERKRPTTISRRVEEAYTPENTRDFERYVRRGATEGGFDWYDMSPLSRAALQEMSPEDFKVLMAMNASTSARSAVQDQIKRAGLAWYYRKQGIPWPMTNEELAKVADPGYGHLAHDIHSQHLAPLVRGEAPNFSSVDQPKYASYYNNFLGNMAPLTADTHYQALHGFPMKQTFNKFSGKYIESPEFSKDVDYPFAEAFSGERARRMGIPLPLYQSAAWVGGKEATGVRDSRPFAAVYDEILKRTADQLDMSPTEALKRHLRGEIPLLPIEKAEGGLVVPKVLYHATTRAIKNLRPGKGKWVGSEDLGVHVGSAESANQRIADAIAEGRRGSPNIMPLLHGMQNPLRMEDVGNWKSPSRVERELARLYPERAEALRAELKHYDSTDNEDGAMQILRRHLTELGHDGVVYKNSYEGGGDSYIVLDPAAIRSKFENPQGFAGGGKVGGLEALSQYIRYRLPREYATAPMRHNPSMMGSGREVFDLGDDKLVKLAKRPRGLYEQSLEGTPGISENLPKLHWRSPDNELAVVERMPLTPRGSENFFEPLKTRYEELNTLNDSPNAAWWAYHRSDPLLSRMMQGAGLGNFSKYDLLGGDFFTRPEEHWAMRKPPMFSADPAEKFRPRPTLLDPGAIDRRLTDPQFERQHAGRFKDILDERVSRLDRTGMRRADDVIAASTDPTVNQGNMYRFLERYGIGKGTEDFIGPEARWPAPISGGESTDELTREIKRLMPQRSPPRQQSMTFASGGQIEHQVRALRNRMAGGGVPRNWLRGVKGSHLEDALDRLRAKATQGVEQQMLDNHEFMDKIEKLYAANPQDRIGNAREGRPADYIKARAMQKWIDTNLSNYIVRQHGTEADPLKVQGILPHPSAAVKRGATDSLEKVAPDYLQHLNLVDEIEMSRLPKWYFEAIKKDKERYQSQREYDRMVNPRGQNASDEPANRLAAQARGRFGSGKEYEDFMREADQKYQRRYTPPVDVYDLARDVWSGYYEPAFRDTLDYLKAHVDPKDMFKVSVPDAVRKSKEWHEQLARKAEEAKNKGLEIGPWLTEHKAYPTGFKWHKYNPEYVTKGRDLEKDSPLHNQRGEFNATPEWKEFEGALRAEGEAMGHCVGDYCTDVVNGGSQIYSLRDPKGRPHVTIEVQPKRPVSSQPWTMDTASEIISKHPGVAEAYAKDFADSGAHSMDYAKNFWPWLKKNHPDVHDSYSSSGPMDIQQIKGKGNAKPIDEYLPYVQDFVRSGKWGEVGDLQNTGLRRIDSGKHGSGGSHYMTDAEAAPFAKYKWSTDLSKGDAATEWIDENEWIKRNAAMPQSPEKDPAKILQRLRERSGYDPMGSHYFDVPNDWKPQGYAAGGRVESPPDFPRESPDEHLMRAKLALQILQEEAQRATPEERPVIDREIQRVVDLIQKLESAGVGQQLGVKDGLVPDLEAAPMDEAGDEGLHDETMDMLGRFVSGDLDDNFLAKLLSEERFSALS